MFRRNLLALVITGVGAILITTMGVRVSVSSAAEAGQRLEGAWMVNVLPEGPDASPPKTEIAAFMADGSLVNVADNGTASVGEWINIGDHQFAVTFIGLFLQDDQPFSFKVRSNITLNEAEDEFSGPFQTDVLDPSGNVVASVSGTVQATRILVEPLE